MTLILFKLITESRPSTILWVFLIGGPGFPLKEKLGGFFFIAKILILPDLLNVFPPKKIECPPFLSSLIASKHSLPKRYAFSISITTHLTKFFGIKSLGTKQHYLKEY